MVRFSLFLYLHAHNAGVNLTEKECPDTNCYLVPWVVWGFFKIITPFIDPVTREKLKFNEDMKQYVPPEQLWSADWGGDMDFDYDHDTYWPALNELCKKRREERRRRWEAGGKIVGESEDYLVGGTDVSVKGIKYDPAAVAAPPAIEGEKEKEDGLGAVEEKLAAAKLEDGEEAKSGETKPVEATA